MQDLFDEIASPRDTGASTLASGEDAPAEKSHVLAETSIEEDALETVEEPPDESDSDEAEAAEGPARSDETADPAGPQSGAKDTKGKPEPAAKAQEPPKQVNIVEQDPYEFEKCLVSIGIGLLPDDGNPDGRPVMLGVRSHQDEPIIRMCRIGDLAPLPDPIQQLLDQLMDELPARSKRATEKKTKAGMETRKRDASQPKPVAKTARSVKTKAESTSLNLFEMFDQ